MASEPMEPPALVQQHRFRFLSRTDPYRGAEAFQSFVGNIESLIAKENSNWSQQAEKSATKASKR